MKTYLIIICFLCASYIHAQGPGKFYTKLGGPGIDIGYAVKQTLEGNYIIAGSTTGSGSGGSDIYLAKLDSMGGVLWNRTLGGFNNDVGKSIVQLSDSGFVIAGFTNSYGKGGYDALLIRTDKNGNQIWLKTFGDLDWDFGYDLIQTADGNIVMCGATSSFGKGKTDGFVVKYDINGNQLWQKLFGGIEDDEFKGICTKNGTEVFVAGMTKSYGEINGDMYVFKLDNNGDSLMRIIYGGNLADNCNDVTVNSNNDIYIAGGSDSFTNGKKDGLIVKFTSNGIYIDRKNLGGVNSDEEIYKIISTGSNFGEIVVIYGEDQGLGTQLDFLTCAFDPTFFFIPGGANGSFGFTLDEVPYDICLTKDKGYAQVGYTKSLSAIDKDILFVKRDSNMKYGPLVVNIKPNSFNKKSIIKLYPNPIDNKNNNLTIDFDSNKNNEIFEVIIYNVAGELIKHKKVEINEFQTTIDVGDLNNGLYILNLKGSTENYFFKILKI